MNLIAAVDRNWAIGNKNKLLVRIPEDQKFFRMTTTGKVVVMGRKTFESLPGGLPLKNRMNIVMTGRENYRAGDAIVAHDLDALYRELQKYDSREIYVIGGQSVYAQLLGVCDTAYITKIDFAYAADAYFPNLDDDPDWELTRESEEQTYFNLEYRFATYKKKAAI